MATVAELRTSFKKDTLRFDKTDAEIDRFLNAGQKWLTRNYGDVLDESELVARHTAAINADDYTVELGSLIAVHSIRVISDSEEIELGVHGVIVTKDSAHRGLFLPQVATDQGWNLEQFLSYLCAHKAGLSADAWKDPSVILEVFTAQVFSEKDF